MLAEILLRNYSLNQFEFEYRYLNLEVLEPVSEQYFVEQDVEPVDWRGYIKQRNQGSCGNSQVFSSLEAVEGLYTVGKNQKVDVSIQQIVDCAGIGCNGGTIDQVLSYIQKNGISTESEYPGNLNPGTCKKEGGSIKIAGYNKLSFVDILFCEEWPLILQNRMVIQIFFAYLSFCRNTQFQFVQN